MNVQRIALGAIAVALVGAEIAAPTHFAPKKFVRSVIAADTNGSGLDENVLDSLPPIDKQALGSIDVIEYRQGPKAVRITSNTSIPQNSHIVFLGWCGDPDVRGSGAGAFLSVDGRERIDVSSSLGGSRPDVAAFLSSPKLDRSGFRIVLLPATIGRGTHEIQFGVIAADRRGYFTLGGPIDLTVR